MENLPKDSRHLKKVRQTGVVTGWEIGEGGRTGDSRTISEGCGGLNLGTVAVFIVILAFSFEARLGRGVEETADFARAGITFDLID